MRHILRALVFAAALAVSLGALPLHFSVVKSSPAKDTTLDAAPKRLQIWFSQAPAPVVSELKLKRDAADVPLGKTVVETAEKSLHADPLTPLEKGAYTLNWRAAGDDGHVMTGEIKFTIQPKDVR